MPKKPAVAAQAAVSQQDFDSLKELVVKMADVVLAPKPANTVQVSVPAEPQQVTSTGETGGSDENPLNPHWRRAVDEILGKDFDAFARYPVSGGCQFTIVVPREKSNAPSLYWEMHKQDRRTREIGNTGLEGVRKWCELIKKNLANSKQNNIN